MCLQALPRLRRLHTKQSPGLPAKGTRENQALQPCAHTAPGPEEALGPPPQGHWGRCYLLPVVCRCVPQQPEQGSAHSRCFINTGEREKGIGFVFFLPQTGSHEGERLSPHLPGYQHPQAHGPTDPWIQGSTHHRCTDMYTHRSADLRTHGPTDAHTPPHTHTLYREPQTVDPGA